MRYYSRPRAAKGPPPHRNRPEWPAEAERPAVPPEAEWPVALVYGLYRAICTDAQYGRHLASLPFTLCAPVH
eukprot:COSAG01_NODE_7693_length_3096_cov_10.868869_5_plen_72_part_00